MRRRWVLVVLLMALAPCAWGQEEEMGSGVQFTGGVGTITIDGKQWQRISLRPDIPLGKFGVSLDIELFVDDQGNFSDKGWRFGNRADAVESILRKIYYVRYGWPKEPVFVKVGSLDDVDLGYGLLMEGYRNSLQYPGVKKLGLQWAIRDLTVMKVGIEGVINNFEDFDRGGPMAGIRLSVKPAATTNVPLLSELEFGVSVVEDFNQFGGLKDSDGDGFPDAADDFPDDNLRFVDTDGDGQADYVDVNKNGRYDRFQDLNEDVDDDNDGLDVDDLSPEQIAQLDGWGVFVLDEDRVVHRKQPFQSDSTNALGMLCLDVGVPVLRSDFLNIDVYGQYARTMDDNDEEKAEGWGIAAPGVRVGIGPLVAKVEYRHLKDQFRANYFDGLYEVERGWIDVQNGQGVTKESSSLDTLKGVTLDGVFGSAEAQILGAVEVKANYQHLMGENDLGEDASNARLYAQASLMDGVLRNVPKLNQVMVYYLKNNIRMDETFFEATPSTLMGYKVGFEIGSGVSLIWHTRYTYGLDEKGDVVAKKTVGVETAMRF